MEHADGMLTFTACLITNEGFGVEHSLDHLWRLVKEEFLWGPKRDSNVCCEITAICCVNNLRQRQPPISAFPKIEVRTGLTKNDHQIVLLHLRQRKNLLDRVHR